MILVDLQKDFSSTLRVDKLTIDINTKIDSDAKIANHLHEHVTQEQQRQNKTCKICVFITTDMASKWEIIFKEHWNKLGKSLTPSVSTLSIKY